MKKFLVLLLASAFIISNVSCTKNDNAQDDASGTEAISESEESSEYNPSKRTIVVKMNEQEFNDYIYNVFYKAQSLWEAFYSFALLSDPEDCREENGHRYQKLYDYESMDDLRNDLLSCFTEEIADSLLDWDNDVPLYKEFDGKLYGLDTEFEFDSVNGSSTYDLEYDVKSGKGTLTVYVEFYGDDPTEYDEETGEMLSEIVESRTVEFPFVKTETGIAFTHFENIW